MFTYSRNRDRLEIRTSFTLTVPRSLATFNIVLAGIILISTERERNSHKFLCSWDFVLERKIIEVLERILYYLQTIMQSHSIVSVTQTMIFLITIKMFTTE